MVLALELIYYGNCIDMISFYLKHFENASAKIRTYREMPSAEILGIKEPELSMIWKASMTIKYGNYAVRFKLSDSLLTARKEKVKCKEQLYHPLICIEHSDEKYVHELLEKLYGGAYCFQDIQKGIYNDKYGIRWIYKKSESCRVYHCLEFKGNCNEVAAYIEGAYQRQITEKVLYANSPYADLDSLESAIHNYRGYEKEDKIWYQIIIAVKEKDKKYLSESFERLSEGATLNRPISLNEEGKLYGSMIDRYGIVWEIFES